MSPPKMSRSGSYKGKSLHVSGLAFRSLRIEPDAGLSSSVLLEATFEDQGEFDRLIIGEGRKVSLTCASRSDHGDIVGSRRSGSAGYLRRLFGKRVQQEENRQVTLKLSLRVPPGFTLSISQGGVGRIDIGPVAGPTDLNVSGSLDLTAVATGPLTLDLSGSSSVRIESVSGPTEMDLSGSGSVVVDGIEAEVLTIETSGTCSTSVRSGRLGRLVVESSSVGSTDVDAVVVGGAEVVMSSVGDVTLRQVSGKVDHDLSGVGTLRINGVRVGR